MKLQNNAKRILSLAHRYGLFGLIRLSRDLVYTLVCFRGARIVRIPIHIRGRRNISISKGFTCGVGNRIDAFAAKNEIVLKIGKNVQINDYNHFAAVEEITIGDNTLIASRVFISDHNHGGFSCDRKDFSPQVPPVIRSLVARPVRIGDNVWIGENVCILPGVSVGDGAVIGAGSVVTRDVPGSSVAVGNPARVIRLYDSVTNEWRRV